MHDLVNATGTMELGYDFYFGEIIEFGYSVLFTCKCNALFDSDVNTLYLLAIVVWILS